MKNALITVFCACITAALILVLDSPVVAIEAFETRHFSDSLHLFLADLVPYEKKPKLMHKDGGR